MYGVTGVTDKKHIREGVTQLLHVDTVTNIAEKTHLSISVKTIYLSPSQTSTYGM